MEQKQGFSYTKVGTRGMASELEKGLHLYEEETQEGFFSRLFGCGNDVQSWRRRYVRPISWVWSALAGPLSGWLAAAMMEDDQLKIVFIMTLMYFVVSMLATAFSHQTSPPGCG